TRRGTMGASYRGPARAARMAWQRSSEPRTKRSGVSGELSGEGTSTRGSPLTPAASKQAAFVRGSEDVLVRSSRLVEVARHRHLAPPLAPLRRALVGHALPPLVAPLQPVEYLLPHLAGRLRVLPHVAAEHADLEVPLPAELLGQQVAFLARLGVFHGPLDL